MIVGFGSGWPSCSNAAAFPLAPAAAAGFATPVAASFCFHGLLEAEAICDDVPRLTYFVLYDRYLF
jgi:hypothetical protein